MGFAEWVAVGSAAIAIVSAVIAFQSARFHILTKYVELDRCVETTPSVLRFHGVTDADLEKAGVTAAELAYLASQFSMVGFYERIHLNMDDGPYSPGSYRYMLCESEATRRAWPLIRRLISGGPYVKRIELTMDLLRREAETAGRV
jgi:hypothetical protein